MVSDDIIQRAIPSAFRYIDLPTLGKHWSGKVREMYDQGDKLILIATDRISCFDDVLRQAIPFKGRVLSQTARFWFEKTKDIVQNHVIDYPHPNVTVVRKAKVWPIEVVVRGYVTGHLWREYARGKRKICGIKLLEGLKENQKLAEPIITPTTKSEHDEDISREDIIKQGLVPKEIWEKIEDVAMKLFARGQEHATKQGLILVDTKYEFGDIDGELILLDEIHTADSSRYWIASEYEKCFQKGEKQKGLDKEYVRQWLIDYGFTGKHGDAAKEGVKVKAMPDLPDDVIITASKKYLELYKKLTGEELDVQEGKEPINENIRRKLVEGGYLCWYQ